MDNHEAKFIRQAYRANGADAASPEMQAALEQARRDPELAKWFAAECALDRAIAGKLGECRVAAGLRSAILAGAKLSPRAPWWRQSWLLAAAACLALGLGLAAMFYPRAVPAGLGLERFATHYTVNGIYLKNESADLGELRAWLGKNGVELPEHLPANLTKIPSVGCRTIDYDGVKVALVCFYKGDHGYHLFMAKKSDMPRADFPEKLRVASLAKNWNSAAWSDDTHHYVLVTNASREELSRLL